MPSTEWLELSGAGNAAAHSGRWTIHACDVVTSTNLVAASLPAWHAVRARLQTAGRGRFQRSWVSDEGGLWLSAVVPTLEEGGHMLPLVAGLGVGEGLRRLGLEHLHMRWPNDLMVGERKLAGFLIDQFVPGLAVVGIGLNVNNHPESCDSALQGHVVRLAECLKDVPTLDELTAQVLGWLEEAWLEVQVRRTAAVLPRINHLLRIPCDVQVELPEGTLTGVFDGVDEAGRLLLRTAGGETVSLEPHDVRLLRSIR